MIEKELFEYLQQGYAPIIREIIDSDAKQFDGNLAMMKELQFLRAVTEKLILLP